MWSTIAGLGEDECVMAAFQQRDMERGVALAVSWSTGRGGLGAPFYRGDGKWRGG